MMSRYRRILAISGCVIFLMDSQRRLVHVSEAIRKLAGYGPDELEGKPLTILVAPEYVARVEHFYEERNHDWDEATTLEFPIVTRDGQNRWMEQIVVGAEGGYQGILLDVTSRRLVEEELLRGEERYVHLLEATFEAVVLHRGGLIVDVNPAFEALFGYTRQEVAGQPVVCLVPESEQENLHSRIDSGAVDVMRSSARRKDGTVFPVELRTKQADFDEGAVRVLAMRDISEHLQAEARYQAIVEDQTEFICRFGPDHHLSFINDAFCRYFGHPREALLGKDFRTMVFKEDRERDQDHLQSLSPGSPVGTIEYRVVLDSGEVRWNSWTDRAIFDESGSPIEFQSVGRDITESIGAQQALRASEARNRALIEAIPDLMFVIDQDGTITDFKASGVEPDGLFSASGQVVGTSIRDIGFPEELLEQTLEHIELALKTDRVQTFEYELPLPDDAVRHYEARVVALNDREVVVIARDISDLRRIEGELTRHVNDLTILRRVEAELAEVLKVDYVVLMSLDSALRLSVANYGFLALLDEGRLKVASWVGPYEEQDINRCLEETPGIVARVMANQQGELIHEVGDDRDYVALIPATRSQIVIPLMSQERLLGVMVLESTNPDKFTRETFEFVELLTARVAAALDNASLYRRAESQLIELQNVYDQMRKLEQLKTDMIRIASHDLRGPLASLLGYLEMMEWEQSTELSDQQKGYLGHISKAAKRMQKITTDILSLERIEQAAQGMNLSQVDLCALVNKAFDEHKPLAEAKSQKIKLSLPPFIAHVHGDAPQLTEAIANLIANAIKFTPEKGKIDVRLRVQSELVVFEVKDTGMGVPESQQDRLFQPFFRAKNSRVKDVEGTGLGLHLVKNIVERHKGAIIFESAEGKGSTFGFSLPIVKDDDEQAEE